MTSQTMKSFLIKKIMFKNIFYNYIVIEPIKYVIL